MTAASIPVDLFNPGQVFACLGFLEAADELCGDAEGGFDWSDEADVRFHLRAKGEKAPVVTVLRFLAEATAKAVAPVGWRPKKEPTERERERLTAKLREQEESNTFPGPRPDTSAAMPVRIASQHDKPIMLSHWADGSCRNEFKLYSGNRSALDIANAMLRFVRMLREERMEDLVKRPFDILKPMAGSFNFDPRGAWTAMDVGYSPNDQRHHVAASPVVEILAAWGMEHARPKEVEPRKVRYAAWRGGLSPILARPALACDIDGDVFPQRRFCFRLDLSGKNKIVTFAQEETHP